MSGIITVIAAGMFASAAVVAILWDEESNLRTYVKCLVASLGIVAAIYILR